MRPLLVCLLVATPAFAAMVNKPITYSVGKDSFEGVLVYDDAVKTPRPGLVLVPNWLGVTPANVKQATEVAGQRYVILVADMYGKGKAPKTQEDAGKVAGALKADRAMMRARVGQALETLKAQAKAAPVDPTKLGAMGFCFGGTTVIELARSGAKVSAVVSIHGGLDSLTPADGKNITAKVLALHGADDPFASAKDVEAFEAEMRDAKVDWQLVKYGGAVHSFTDPDAAMPGKAQFNPVVAKRAFEATHRFFAEVFGG